MTLRSATPTSSLSGYPSETDNRIKLATGGLDSLLCGDFSPKFTASLVNMKTISYIFNIKLLHSTGIDNYMRDIVRVFVFIKSKIYNKCVIPK